jgi:hypothetical protein
MLEALLLAAGISTAVANPQAKPDVAPSAELLEFIADWSEPEARQILDPKHAQAPLPTLEHATPPSKKPETRNER